jgi:hypothetical protein
MKSSAAMAPPGGTLKRFFMVNRAPLTRHELLPSPALWIVSQRAGLICVLL